MTARWTIFCDGADLAVEVAGAAADIGLGVEPVTSEHPVQEARAAVGPGARVACAVSAAPAPDEVVRLAAAARKAAAQVCLAVLDERDAPTSALAVAADLGVPAVDDVRPLAALLATVGTGIEQPWAVSVRGLGDLDRRRLSGAVRATSKAAARLVREDDGLLGIAEGATRARLGEARDVAAALLALAAAQGAGAEAPPVRVPTAAERRAVHDVIFGPPRALSDPASKAALAPYAVPLPEEELVTSPSRAASEAARIGFPVRIALASPDLRVWDHPDLAVDGVDNAARVRDVYRAVHALAAARAPDARVLGVSVSTTLAAKALLRVRASALPEGFVLFRLGFADPHGLAAGDHTELVLPAATERIERALGRLAGSALLFGRSSAERRGTVDALADVLGRITAFVSDHRAEVDAVEIDPLVVRVAGGVEIREACVHVGDAFARALREPAVAAG